MGVAYTKVDGNTYRASFWSAKCYVRRLGRFVWVADAKLDDLDDDLTTYKTRKQAASAYLAKLLKK